ncbi:MULTISPECIES: hypothetical protein [Paenibacillus]|uniref:Lipoprotein n=1 Tax=Paenibacillus albilobatus TaxID=2716884 RepID=A0A920CDC6_9BACL|nr:MULTISPECIES: hypothetical protein [Paenibacillus]GIO33673.1 hypothetical protein J2TS6_48140 [Paenibacillus albilobatus]
MKKTFVIPAVAVLISALLGGCNSGQADELATAKTELEKLKTEVTSLNDEVKESKDKVASLEKENKTLTEQLALYHEQTNKGSEPTTSAAISDPVEQEYAKNFIEVVDLKAKWYTDSLYGNKVAGYTYSLKNKGNKDVEYLTVTLYFMDKDGKTISEASLTPINPADIFDNKPLKANYSWKMDSGTYYQAKDVSKDWKEGSVKAEVTEIRFKS